MIVQELKIVGGLLLLGAGAGAFIYGISKAQNKIKTKRENKILDEGSPEYFASVFNRAISGLGTDEEAIFNNLAQIKTKSQFDKIEKAYFKLYDNSLIDDLEGDLSSDEMKEFSRILFLKPF